MNTQPQITPKKCTAVGLLLDCLLFDWTMSSDADDIEQMKMLLDEPHVIADDSEDEDDTHADVEPHVIADDSEDEDEVATIIMDSSDDDSEDEVATIIMESSDDDSEDEDEAKVATIIMDSSDDDDDEYKVTEQDLEIAAMLYAEEEEEERERARKT